MKYKEFEWVRRVIISCETFGQLRTPITNLIYLFNDKYGDSELLTLLIEERENHKLYN